MPHIHTSEGAYDQTASAFIVRTDGLQPKLVLHRHKILQTYLQFGGHVEINENPWQAVAHEIQQESGYAFSQLHVLQPPITLPQYGGKLAVMHPYPLAVISHPFDQTKAHFHTDISWAFTTNEDPSSAPANGESQHIELFTKDQLLQIPDVEIIENVRLVGLYVLDVCLKEWNAVQTEQFAI